MRSGGVGDPGPGDRLLGLLQTRVRDATVLAEGRAVLQQHRLRSDRQRALRRRHLSPRRSRALRRTPTSAHTGARVSCEHCTYCY